MPIVKDYRVKVFIISGKNRQKNIMNKRKTSFLTIKLVDLVEIKDLEINLVNKKIY